MEDMSAMNGLRGLNPYIPRPRRLSECPWSFVSQHNGYRYCREPRLVL